MAFLAFCAQPVAAMLAAEQALKEKGMTQSVANSFPIKHCLNAIKERFGYEWLMDTLKHLSRASDLDNADIERIVQEIGEARARYRLAGASS